MTVRHNYRNLRVLTPERSFLLGCYKYNDSRETVRVLILDAHARSHIPALINHSFFFLPMSAGEWCVIKRVLAAQQWMNGQHIIIEEYMTVQFTICWASRVTRIQESFYVPVAWIFLAGTRLLILNSHSQPLPLRLHDGWRNWEGELLECCFLENDSFINRELELESIDEPFSQHSKGLLNSNSC
jgi:hypothetical protein